MRVFVGLTVLLMSAALLAGCASNPVSPRGSGASGGENANWRDNFDTLSTMNWSDWTMKGQSSFDHEGKHFAIVSLAAREARHKFPTADWLSWFLIDPEKGKILARFPMGDGDLATTSTMTVDMVYPLPGNGWVWLYRKWSNEVPLPKGSFCWKIWWEKNLPDLTPRKICGQGDVLLDGVRGFDVSHNGKRLMIHGYLDRAYDRTKYPVSLIYIFDLMTGEQVRSVVDLDSQEFNVGLGFAAFAVEDGSVIQMSGSDPTSLRAPNTAQYTDFYEMSIKDGIIKKIASSKNCQEIPTEFKAVFGHNAHIKYRFDAAVPSKCGEPKWQMGVFKERYDGSYQPFAELTYSADDKAGDFRLRNAAYLMRGGRYFLYSRLQLVSRVYPAQFIIRKISGPEQLASQLEARSVLVNYSPETDIIVNYYERPKSFGSGYKKYIEFLRLKGVD
jgi:hypothetical protein